MSIYNAFFILVLSSDNFCFGKQLLFCCTPCLFCMRSMNTRLTHLQRRQQLRSKSSMGCLMPRFWQRFAKLCWKTRDLRKCGVLLCPKSSRFSGWASHYVQVFGFVGWLYVVLVLRIRLYVYTLSWEAFSNITLANTFILTTMLFNRALYMSCLNTPTMVYVISCLFYFDCEHDVLVLHLWNFYSHS